MAGCNIPGSASGEQIGSRVREGARFVRGLCGEREGISIRSYRDLAVWQKAMDMVVECYRLAGRFPTHETYGLALQLRRAAVSVPANIAEGRARRRTAEFVRFVSIAYGSLAELETHIEVAERLGYTDPSRTKPLFERTAEIGRMLNGLTNALTRRENRTLNPES